MSNPALIVVLDPTADAQKLADKIRAAVGVKEVRTGTISPERVHTREAETFIANAKGNPPPATIVE